MKLLAKFNLILGLVMGAGLAVAGFVSYRFLQEDPGMTCCGKHG